MHTNANGKPRAFFVLVSRDLKQFLSGLDCRARMIYPSENWKVQPYHFIANKLVNEGIRLNEHSRCHFIEPIHQATEFSGAHLLGKAG